MPTGVRTQLSRFEFDEAVKRLEDLLREKGIELFCTIDHSGGAAAVGLEMPKTKLLIFGNPKAGTPLMLRTPSAALDLPLKLLIAETEGGDVMLSWNDPAWLQDRHGFGRQLEGNLGAAEMLAGLVS